MGHFYENALFGGPNSVRPLVLAYRFGLVGDGGHTLGPPAFSMTVVT